jgi:hypothetical protein
VIIYLVKGRDFIVGGSWFVVWVTMNKKPKTYTLS